MSEEWRLRQGWLTYLRNRRAWSTVRTIATVRSERTVGGETSIYDRHYISSLDHQPERILLASDYRLKVLTA